MTEKTALEWLKVLSSWTTLLDEPKEACELAINALEVNEKITEIVNRQLIARKNNYKEIYNSFYEIVKVVQENYRWSEV